MIAANYDAILLDLWGVVHDGEHLYPGVHDALKKLKEAGKKVVFLSNAPRSTALIEAKLEHLGVSRDLYDGVVSSGDTGCRWLASGSVPWGNKYYFLGDPKDEKALGDLPFQRVQDMQQADFILNVGFGDMLRQVEEDMPLLRDAQALNKPMLCLNPDLEVVKHNGARHPCAGAIAGEYEKMGGKVTWFGKPYVAVYDRCMELLPGVDKHRVLAVGDSLDTDIPGARNFGIDSLLVTGGILHDESPANVAKLCAERNLDPTYVIPGFSWKTISAPAR